MWFLRDLGRLNRERQAVATLEASCAWLDGVQWRLVGHGLIIDADIVPENNRRYSVRLQYPELYPSVLPSVRPKEPASWSSHQYGDGGELCLELGPDNWHPESHTAANLFESTYRLLRLEAEHEADTSTQIPSRHQLTAGQAQRFRFIRWVVTPAAREALDALPDGSSARCELYAMSHEEALTVFLKRIENASGDDWKDPGVPAGLKHLGRRSNGAILTGQKGALTLASLEQPSTFTSLLQNADLPASEKEGADGDLNLIEYVFLKGFGGEWQAHWRWAAGDSVASCSTLHADTTSSQQRHGLDDSRLKDSKVAIVGLGSAGSKIAAGLARSGVGEFFLLDDDLLHPANLVRHDSDWFDVGQHKVDATAERLARINPSVKVTKRRHRLNGQESSAAAASALSALGQSDLIIDATADSGVFNLCAHVARHSTTPLIWVEIYAGGLGGLIARSRPDKEAEPFTLRAAINSAASTIADQKGVEPPEGAVANYGAVSDEGQIVVASDPDVTTVAGHATQLALDTLLERTDSHFAHPAYLVGFAKGWIFEEAFHTIPIDCSASADWSTVVHTDEVTRKDATAFVAGLIEELSSDADAEPTE